MHHSVSDTMQTNDDPYIYDEYASDSTGPVPADDLLSSILTANIGHPIASSTRIQDDTLFFPAGSEINPSTFTTVPIETTVEEIRRENENINEDTNEIIDKINRGNIEEAESLIQTENILPRLQTQPFLERAIINESEIQEERRLNSPSTQNIFNPTVLLPERIFLKNGRTVWKKH